MMRTEPKNWLAWIAVGLLAAGLSGTAARADDDEDEHEGEWIQLFNGKDLSGWTPKIRHHECGENFANTFRVEDGLLKVRYDGYEGEYDERFGHIFYEKPFSHYVLRVEYRFVGDQMKGGPGWATRNSGIMLHGQTPESMTIDQDFPVSVEVQLLGGLGTGKRTTANVCTPGTHIMMDGKLITQHCTSSTSETYDGDQWVTVEVEVHGNEVVRHKIDGKTIFEFTHPQLDPNDENAKKLIDQAGGEVMLSGGTISLQSESHPCDFRKVEILILDDDEDDDADGDEDDDDK